MPSFNFRNLNGILEEYSDFSTLPERSINLSLDVIVALNGNLFPHKLFYVQELLTEQVFDNYGVIVNKPIYSSSFVLLLEKFYLSLRILCDYMSDLTMEGNSTHFLFNIDVKFISDDLVVQR